MNKVETSSLTLAARIAWLEAVYNYYVARLKLEALDAYNEVEELDGMYWDDEE